MVLDIKYLVFDEMILLFDIGIVPVNNEASGQAQVLNILDTLSPLG